MRVYAFALTRFLYKLYFGAVFYVFAILFFPFFIIAYNTSKPIENGLTLKRLWTKCIQLFVFVPLKIEGKECFPKQSGYVVVSNHASYLDIILMFGVVPGNFVFMGKSELLGWPFLSYVFGKTDIPINRVDMRQAQQAVEKAAQKLKEGVSVIVFPEGMMPETSPEMARFKSGAFRLSVEQNVPIVPITFVNNWKLFSDHTDYFRRGKPGLSKVYVHEPLFPKENSRQEILYLQEECYRLIDSKIDKYDPHR
jgi:1-acyl-sn-glycerol-3-phosphate acyltransferase